ncbi:MAG: tRNA pseudouridine(13) synthase TruD, partial [Planctomycetota bacterium]|nr:tRNA pseudouridine(13) synthase TruD [Planctomycetota bacterium]
RLLIGTPARKDTGTRRTLTRACATHWGDWKAIIANSQPHSERRAIETLAAGKSFRDAFAALPNFIQQLAIEAYQSSLWNRTVARMCRDAGLTKEAGSAIVADGICEELVFPDARALPSAWLGESVPMLAPDVPLRGLWAAAARAELTADGLELDQLRLLGLRRPAFGTSLRPIVAKAESLAIDDAEADVFAPKRLARRVRFTLPRGAYATVLLMALGQ